MNPKELAWLVAVTLATMLVAFWWPPALRIVGAAAVLIFASVLVLVAVASSLLRSRHLTLSKVTADMGGSLSALIWTCVTGIALGAGMLVIADWIEAYA